TSARASSGATSTRRATWPPSSDGFAKGQMSKRSTTSWIQRALMRSASSSSDIGSELVRHRQEGHLVVGFAQAPRQRAHEVPQELVRQIAVDEEQVLEVFLANDEEAALLVHDG